MRLTKKELTEIIDSNDELIGANDIPSTGGDIESQSNNTTDYNVKVGNQPYSYDFIGRLGFGFLPFFEGKENKEQTEIVTELYDLVYDRFFNIMRYYYKNPNKLKNDYRKMSENRKDKSDPQKENNYRFIDELVKIINKYYESTKIKTIDESTMVEDKMIEKKGEEEISNRSEDGEIKEKQIEKIAGLINKMDKKDVDKLINLVERK